MILIEEPPNKSFVVVEVDEFFFELFRREDEFAARLKRNGGNWVGQSGDVQVKSWHELLRTGRVALVGDFQDHIENARRVQLCSGPTRSE